MLKIPSRRIHYLRSKLFIPNFVQIEKENPKGTNTSKSISSIIMEKNGFISGSKTSGLTTFLPLGKRVLNKITEIIREEMNKIGGQEISMPCLSDLSLWKKTQRDEIIGNELFKLEDRKKRQLCLCPTHEEIVTSLVANYSKSLNSKIFGEHQALSLYQITTKYRDEPQPKHGLLRGREFLMKDMYSFHLSDQCARNTYENVCKGYESILNRLDLKYIKVQASTGAMGGTMSHEYQVESPIGEDTIFECKECGKAVSNDMIDPNKGNIENMCDIFKCDNRKGTSVLKKTSIEVGHAFILGDRYTKVFPFSSHEHVLMGCYGIGVSRLIQACVEFNQQNERYPNWPMQIAPFQVIIIPPKNGSKEEANGNVCVNKLLEEFSGQISFKDDILVDDRTDMSIGSRLIDAKLVGSRYIIVLGKLLNQNKVEIIINSKSIENVIKKESFVCSINDVLKTIIKFDHLYNKAKNI